MNNHNYNAGPDFPFPTSPPPPPPPPPPTSRTQTHYQDAATAFASSSSTCFNITESKDHHQHQQNPRKKRSKLMRQDNDNPTKRPKCVKKPDPSAPKITTPCSECGRKFWSWKALFGHMRCHPERQWRGIDPPPDLRRTVSPNRVVTELELSMSEEDHDAASSLLILASGTDQTQVAGTSWQGVGENDSGGRFECSSCKKVFGSHQALGGHRASHKNVKGCFAITKTDVEVDQDHHQTGAAGHGYGGVDEHNVDDVMEENKMVMVLESAHQCSICWRVFSSGQALGGHKRCHWEKGEEASVVMTQLGLSNNTNYGGLDLNLPASASAATATANTVEDDQSSSYSSAGLALDLRLGL